MDSVFCWKVSTETKALNVHQRPNLSNVSISYLPWKGTSNANRQVIPSECFFLGDGYHPTLHRKIFAMIWYDTSTSLLQLFYKEFEWYILWNLHQVVLFTPTKRPCNLQHDTLQDFRFKWHILQRWCQWCIPFPKKTVGCCVHYCPNSSCSNLSTWNWWLEKPCNEIGCDLAQAICVVFTFHGFEVS